MKILKRALAVCYFLTGMIIFPLAFFTSCTDHSNMNAYISLFASFLYLLSSHIYYTLKWIIKGHVYNPAELEEEWWK